MAEACGPGDTVSRTGESQAHPAHRGSGQRKSGRYVSAPHALGEHNRKDCAWEYV